MITNGIEIPYKEGENLKLQLNLIKKFTIRTVDIHTSICWNSIWKWTVRDNVHFWKSAKQRRNITTCDFFNLTRANQNKTRQWLEGILNFLASSLGLPLGYLRTIILRNPLKYFTISYGYVLVRENEFDWFTERHKTIEHMQQILYLPQKLDLST